MIISLFSIALGLALILFRKRLAADAIRSEERLWRAKYVGNHERLYVWLHVVVGVGFALSGIMELAWGR